MPVVCLPGLFAGGWIWDGLVELPATSGLDLTVFNDAIPVTFGNTIDSAVAALDLILEDHQQKPFLVGNSLGALIALHYAALRPSRVRGLVMSGSPGQVELEAGVTLQELRTGNRRYAEILMSNIFHDKSKVPERGIAEVMTIFGDPQTFRNVTRWLSFTRKYDVEEALHRVSTPIHFAWGSHDNITPAEPWTKLAEQFANVDMTIFDGVGHSHCPKYLVD